MLCFKSVMYYIMSVMYFQGNLSKCNYPSNLPLFLEGTSKQIIQKINPTFNLKKPLKKDLIE